MMMTCIVASLLTLKAEGNLPAPIKILYSGGNLTIVNLGKEDHGIYECIASNVVSRVITTTLLIIERECRTCIFLLVVSIFP